jgi:DUF4097 and DUF4098 domain-containing protein YvlB
MRRQQLTAAVLMLAFAAGALGNDISKVNTSIRVGADERVGDVSTVNGSIRLADRVTAEDVHTVNGTIDIGRQAVVAHVKTVNGSIRLDDGVTATGIESVNGSLTLGAGTRVSGSVGAVNSSITLPEGSDIGGDVHNVNGRIVVDAAHVAGRVEAVVGGTLEFENDVELYVSDRAKIGPIEGAKAIMFSGALPESSETRARDEQPVER